MANSDYILRNQTFGFCPWAVLASSISPLGASATISGLTSPFPNPIRVGMAAMIGSGRGAEIVSVEAVTGSVLTLGRGCCDTVPRAHDTGTVIWFFDDSIGRDTTQYGSSEVIGVKVLPRTLTGGQVPVEYSAPKQITMSHRFARPYPPGNVRVNGNDIEAPAVLSDTATPLVLTWAHRDRLTQADLLVKHGEASVGPEAGTTYTVEVVNDAGTVVKTVSGISGTSWSYGVNEARADLGVVGGDVSATVRLKAVRDGLDSWQSYVIPIAIGLGEGCLLDPLYNGDSTTGRTVLLLKGAQSPFVDSSATPKTISNSGATRSTTITKYGQGSIEFDGSSSRVFVTPQADFIFSTGVACTIEGHFRTRRNVAPAGYLFTVTNASLSSNFAFFYVAVGTGGNLVAACYNGSVSSVVQSSAGSIANDTWYRFALTITAGGVARLFINNVLVATVSGWVWFPTTGTPLVSLGGYANGYVDGNAGYFNGNIEFFRVTRWNARYSETFTEPDLPFCSN